MKKGVVIVAGGKGLRMGGEIPKQFIDVNGLPVLMHTVNNFYSYDSSMEIIIVLPVSQQAYWKSLCDKYSFNVPYIIADGGETRFHSVRNGLNILKEADVVAVHDGVRPFVSHEVIDRCFMMAAVNGTAVPVVNVVETLRHVEADSSCTVSRDEYKLVQTPQVFNTKLLKQAYSQEYVPSFTDDASVVEAMGGKIYLTDGNRENIKLTTPFDLKLAELLC